jgi:hypothetical protein
MKSRTALAAEAYLDCVYAYLPPVVRDWASRPNVRSQWMVFAVSHVKTLQCGFAGSTARDLAEAIEGVWRERGPAVDA